MLASLQTAGQSETQARAAIADMDRQENAAMEAWADAGAIGEVPTFDHAAREGLNRQLVEAQSKSRAAAAASAPVQENVLALDRSMKVEMDNMTVCAMAVLAAEAEGLGAAYQEALIAVERHRIELQTLNHFLASKQDLDNQGTTAFLPIVVPHLEQRHLYLEPIRVKAMNEANARWQTLWSQSLRVPA
ncbi:hypothetical protein [Rhodanobacter sp. L36]|uniref:hypothetical protein n=1 Tax=Rhodanobacter sp. L36 TaxID=1747221 RepID=UPI001C2026C2|nr:hypothetical protein [Rhodanobacter sp. L36]